MTVRSQTNQPAQYFSVYVYAFSTDRACRKQEYVFLLVSKICQCCPACCRTASFILSVKAESCLRTKQVTGALTSAGHYTDLTPFNSVRHSANQSQLPACCSPKMPAARLRPVFWLLVLFWHREWRRAAVKNTFLINVCCSTNTILTSNCEMSLWCECLTPLSQYAWKF